MTAAATTQNQADLFGNPPPHSKALIGVCVTAPVRCPRCHSTAAVIGAGKGPHCAALMCVCGRHCGWISTASLNFISETVRRFGRPTDPIVMRTPKDSGQLEAVRQPNSTER